MRKAALVDAIHQGLLQEAEMLALHSISDEEFESWLIKRFEAGCGALRSTRLQDYPEVRT